MRYTFSIVFLLFSIGLQSQNLRLQKWCSGEGLDFTCYPPTKFATVALGYESNTSICDSAGNLLCYYSNNEVYNRLHQRMPNGFNILGDEAKQWSLLIPAPIKDKYYLITEFQDWNDWQYYVSYTVIDMSLNNGLGDVTEKNKIIVKRYAPTISATHHANGRDIWLLLTNDKSNIYDAFLITPTGIAPPVSSQAFVPVTPRFFKFSANSQKAALMCEFLSTGSDQTFIFNFNPATGQLTENFYFDEMSTGMSFSADGSKFYFSNFYWSAQYDVNTRHKTLLTGFPYCQSLQLASDGRIYGLADNNDLLVIHYPTLEGVASNYEKTGLKLNGFFPNLIESPFGCLPLAGNYTIAPNKPYACRNFKSFNQAIEALKCGGISDAVTFDVASGTYNEQITIPYITGSSASDTITFRSASGVNSDVALKSTLNKQIAVLILDSTAYLRFYNLTIENARIQTFASDDTTKNCLNIINSKNIIFENNRFFAPIVYLPDLAYGVCSVGGCDSVKLNKNMLNNGTEGYWITKSSHLKIADNHIQNYRNSGIITSQSEYVHINGNYLKSTSNVSLSGISLSLNSKNVLVEKNIINLTSNAITIYGVVGIGFFYGYRC